MQGVIDETVPSTCSKHAYIGIQPTMAFFPIALQGSQKKGAGLCIGNTLGLVL